MLAKIPTCRCFNTKTSRSDNYFLTTTLVHFLLFLLFIQSLFCLILCNQFLVFQMFLHIQVASLDFMKEEDLNITTLKSFLIWEFSDKYRAIEKSKINCLFIPYVASTVINILQILFLYLLRTKTIYINMT